MEELRVRARLNLQLERLSALLPTFSFSPDVLDRWNDLQPAGTMEALRWTSR
ncbi:hypothetical protein M8494_28765 [Serratia ureilytica]